MNHLYIISGKANTGKTHTCWLLYTMLSCLGEVKLFENLGFPNAAIPYSFVLGHLQRKMLHPRTRSFRDFRAIIELKGKRIALFSAGDQLENNHNDILSLLKNEQWAHDNSADYIICAARERNYEHRGCYSHYSNGQIYEYLLKEFSESERTIYHKESYTNADLQVSQTKEVAGKILWDIIDRIYNR